MQKIKDSFKSVFLGGATNQQFVIVFFTILVVVSLVLVPFFMLKR
jgi:hypothetical protein